MAIDTSGLSEDVRRPFLLSASQPAVCYGMLLGRTKQSSSWCPFDVHDAHAALCEGQWPSKHVVAVDKDAPLVQEDVWKRSAFLNNGVPTHTKQAAISRGPGGSWARSGRG